MLDDILAKIRALIEDFGTECPDIFTYDGTTSSFVLCASSITSINSVLLNGTALGSGEYDFDSTTNTITILVALTNNDQIQPHEPHCSPRCLPHQKANR